MAGNTAVISMVHFAVDWADHVPIAALCERYSVTKDQVLRLKVIWQLAPRHDRSLRAKPKWSPKPSSEEDKASGESCDLAPEIARRVAELKSGQGGVQIHGTHCRPEEGTVPFTVQVVGIRQLNQSVSSSATFRNDEFYDDTR